THWSRDRMFILHSLNIHNSSHIYCSWYFFCSFFNDTAASEIYTLSLHDALPIFLKRRGCLTVPRLTLMSLIKMMLVMVSVAAISKTFGLLRFLLRLSFLAK